MGTIVPYLLAASGAYMLLLALVTTAHGVFFMLIAKVVPILLGAACLWVSALALAGGAS